MTELAAMTDRKDMMFRTRITFRITYPGPATERLKKTILRARKDKIQMRSKYLKEWLERKVTKSSEM